MAAEPKTLEWLVEENARLEAAIALLNDAAFGFMGIASRVLVENGLISREDLAGAIAHRAGSVDRDDHNQLLMAFSRAVRMNLPGGRFEVIEGGRSDLDPD